MMAESPQQSPGVLSRFGRWLWGWGSPALRGDAPPSEAEQSGQEDENNTETGCQTALTAGADETDSTAVTEIRDHTSVPEDTSPSPPRNAKHLSIGSGGGDGVGEKAKGRRIQVYLQDTSRSWEVDSESEPLIPSTVKKNVQVCEAPNTQSQSLEGAGTDRPRSEPIPAQVTSELPGQQKPGQMGRRRSGRRRRSSQGDGGRTQSKSPITSQPGSPATTSLATSPQSACADSAFGVESQTTLNSSRTAPPNSPGTGSCEDGVQTEWIEANMGEHATDRLGALDAPVHAARARVIDSDMEDEAVVRLTETPESKRRSLKVSHSEKIFAKKVLVTADEDVNVKIKGARDNADPKLLWSNDKGRHPEEKVDFTSVKTGQAVRRIAEKISLFENRAASTAKSSSSNLRSLEISPARKVADRLREFSEHAGTRTTSVPSNQTVKERAANFTAAQKGEVKSTPAFGKAGVIDHPMNGGHSKTTDQTETPSENTPNTEWTETSRDKPEIKIKPPLNVDQTDSKSHNATEVVPALSENDSKLGNKEVKSCLPQPVTSPTDEIPQAKPLSRTGSRSKRRRSKDVSQPLSPISANKEETLQDKQEVKETDRKNTSAPKIPSKPPMDKRDAIKTIDKYFKSTSEKVTTNSAGEKTVNKKPKVPPKLVKTQKIEHSTENTPDTDSKRLKLQQTDTKCLKEMKGTDKKDRENKDCFENKTVSSEPQTLISPTSRENNSQCENSSNRKQTEQKNINPESEKQHKNCNNKQLVQETSEREDGQEKTNRDTIVNTLFEESGKPDPSVTNEEKPPSPETLKETDYKDSSKPANGSHATSRRDAMQNGKSTTNKEFLPENNKATCEPKMKIAKPEEVQTVKSSPEERDTYRQTLDSQEGQMLTDHCSADVLAHPGMTERDTVIDESLVDPTNSDAYKSDSKAKVKVTKPSEEKGPVTEATNQHKERATVTNENEERKSKNKIKYKSKEKVCLTENSTQNEKKDNVAKTTDQNMEIKTTETPKPSHENSKSETTMQNIAEEMITKTTKQDKSKDTSTVRPNVAVQEHTTITANSQEKSNETQNIEKDTSTGLTNQNTEEDTSTNLTNQNTKTDISTGFTNENGDVHMNGDVHLENTVCLSISPANKKPISLLHTANDSSINKPDQAKEKTPSLLEDEPSPILSSTTNAKTIPPPVQKHETPTSLPASTNEKVIPTSTNEKTLPDSAIEKTTPPLDRANEDTTIDITPPPDQTHEKPLSFPVSTNEETKPLPASTNEKSSILPDSAIEKTTSPSDSANKDTTIDITPPPDQTHETPSSFSVSTNEDTIPPPASTNEKISTLPDTAIEKTTSPSDSANEKTTFDITPPSAQIDETPTSLPTSNIEKNSPLPDSAIEKTTPPLDWANEEITIDITPPPAQIHETPSSFPVSTNEETIPLPASTNETSSILPDSAIEKTTPPIDRATEETTIDITPPPAQIHEIPSSFPVSTNEETIPLPASTNEKSSILPDSAIEKTTPPLDRATEETTIDITPPPAQIHEKPSSFPVSTNEETKPLPASTNEKISTLPDSANEKTTPPSDSTTKKTTNDITPPPDQTHETPSSFPVSTNEETIPLPASTNEKSSILPDSAIEKTTPPSDSTTKKTTNDITPPPDQTHETPSSFPVSINEETIPLPASTNEKSSILPDSEAKKTTPPSDSANKDTTIDITPPSDLANEKTTSDITPAQTHETLTSLPVSTNEKTIPPPALTNEKTSTLPDLTNEKISSPPASTNGKITTLPVIKKTTPNKKTTPPLDSTIEKINIKKKTPPSNSANKTTTIPSDLVIEKTPNQKIIPPLKSIHETATIPSGSAVESTHPPSSTCEITSILPVSSNEKTTPPHDLTIKKTTNSNSTALLDLTIEQTTPPSHLTIEVTRNEMDTPSPDLYVEQTTNEKTTIPVDSTVEKTTPPPASSNEITSTLPASTNKITSPPPDLIKEATSTLPASTNEETMPTSLSSKRPSSPVSSQDKSIQENTSPLLALSLPTSTNKNTTHPTVSNDETVSLLTKNERVMPLPASANENQKQFPSASTNGENKTPPPSVKEKTVPSPDNAKTLPSPASINEKIKPPPASANGKVSHPTTEQYPPSVSPTKPQSSDPATRKKKFVMKPFKLPQIPSARGTSSLNKDSLSSWLDVDHQRPVKKKQLIPEPKAKHSSPVSKTKLNTSGEYDPDDFIANVKRLAMPFSLPQRKHNHHRLHVPPMPAIKEDEKPFDPEEFQVGLRRRREFTLDLIPSARSKLKHTDPKEEDTTAKRINPERESILMRSLLFKNAQKKPVKKEEGSNEKKIEPLVRSRLERCSILNSLRTTSRDRKMEILSPTETPSDKVLSPTDSPDSSVPPEEQSAPAAESPTQDTADEAKNDKMDSSSCTNTGSQVVLQPTKDNDPIITPDPKTTSENSTVTVVPDSAPLPASCTQTSSEEVLKPDKEDVQVITTDLNTTSAQPTVTTVTDLDAPPPLPSFNDIKLPSYLDKFLPKEPETAQASNRINPQVARESASTPGLVDLNKTVDKEAADSKIAEVKIPLAPQLPGAQIPHADHQREQQNVPAVRGFHRRPGKIVIFEGHQFTGRSFEFYGDQPDCSHLQLSSVISLKVVRGCWVLYEKPGYEGRCIGLEEEWIIELPNEWAEEAEQTSAPMVIGSMRLVVRDYSPPCIELFTEHSGRGRSIKYEDDTQEVSTFGLPMNTGSIKVHSGLWLIYSDPDFQGLLAVLETGEYPFPEIWGFPSPTVGSLRPLRMGGLKVENPNEVKAVLYEEAGLKGRCVEVQGDVFSFGETQSDNHGIQRVESLKILGGLWLGFEHEDFEGQQFILEEGEYLDWKDWGGAGPNLLSLRPVLTDFSSPHIKMFREPDFAERGINVDLMEPLENAANTQYGPQTQSIDVLSGVWVAFEEPGFSGQPYVLEKGLYSSPEDWGASSNRITSVLPVTLENIGNSCHFKMELFSEPEFCGSSVVLEDSLPTMPAGFTVLSCKVLAGSWLAFSAEGFSGSQCVLEEGDYLDLSIMGFTQPDSSVLSLKPVGHEFSLPSIVLFERSGLRGRRTVLKSSSVNLQLTNSCTRVSSILVEGGMWVLYEGNNFRGSQILLKPGEVPDWPKLSTWQRIGSLRPLIQKQVHFRLRNEEAGLLMSVTGSNDDIKLMRIQVTEETAGVEQIWFNQDGHLHCKWLTDCCVDVSSGVLMPGSRAVLSAEPGKPQQLWNFTQDGFIRNNAAPGLVLDVKGGQQFDKNQIVLSEFNPNKPSQRWALELL